MQNDGTHKDWLERVLLGYPPVLDFTFTRRPVQGSGSPFRALCFERHRVNPIDADVAVHVVPVAVNGQHVLMLNQAERFEGMPEPLKQSHFFGCAEPSRFSLRGHDWFRPCGKTPFNTAGLQQRDKSGVLYT